MFAAVPAVGVSGGCPKVCVSLATKPQLPVPWQRLPLFSLVEGWFSSSALCSIAGRGKKKKKSHL